MSKGLASLLISRHRALGAALRALVKEHEGDQLDMFVVDRHAPRPSNIAETEFQGVVVAVGRDKHCSGCFAKAEQCAGGFVATPATDPSAPRQCCPDCSHGAKP
jgi:hypothetical protein